MARKRYSEEDIIKTELRIEAQVSFKEDSGWRLYGATPALPDEYLSNKYEYNKYGNIAIKGVMPEYPIGAVVKVEMVKEENKTYGTSYNVIKIWQDVPVTGADQKEYIKMFVTELQLESIYNVYGEDDNVIQKFKDDTFDWKAVYGFGEVVYNHVKKKLLSNLELMEAIAELSKYGITYQMIAKLMGEYTSASILINDIKQNPYILTKVDGIGFKKADEIAIDMGIDLKSEMRIEACFSYVLNEEAESSGHCWMPMQSFVRSCVELLEIQKSYVKGLIDKIKEENEEAWNAPDDEGEFVEEILNDKEQINKLNRKLKYHIEDKRIALNKYYFCEEDISDNLFRLLNGENNTKVEDELIYKFIDEVEEEHKAEFAKDGKAFEYTDEQKLAIFQACAKNVMLLNGKAGTGKAQPLSSLIMTGSGYKKMGDIKIGDKVYGEDGRLHNVIGVYPQGKKDVYKISFQDGTYTHSCKEHLWTVRKQYGYVTKQLSEIIDDGLYTMKVDKNNRSGFSKSWKYQIPVTKPLQMDSKKVPVNPYLLGFLIGDGTLGDKKYSTKISINQNEIDLIEKVKSICKESGYEFDEYNKIDKCTYRIKSKSTNANVSLHKKIKELNLNTTSEYKFIPDIYKYNDISVRTEILKGLIDSDGTIDGSAYSFSTSSKQLADDVLFLVQSLGGIATIGVKENACYKNKIGEKVLCKKSYRLYIKIDIEIHSSKKHSSKIKKANTKVFRSIRNIEFAGEEECQCIMVDNPSHLYLTDNLIVTHNTTVLKGIVKVNKKIYEHLSESGDRSKILHYDTCALSGKAAQRITESTGLKSATIHRLLGYCPQQGFAFNAMNQLETDIVVLDEASMVNNLLFRSLISAIPTGSKLIILGDTEQLAPIGAGNILKDMIDSGTIPNVVLTVVHRQAKMSGILSTANDVRDGIQFNEKGNYTNRIIGELQDFYFYPYKNKETVYKKVIDVCKAYKGDIMDFQVITPLKTRGELCTKKLNIEMQEIFNPRDEWEDVCLERNGYKFRVGDKVIQCGNNYDYYVFNGTLGIVKDVDVKGKKITILFSGVDLEVTYTQNQMSQIELGYALSVHRMQGSQTEVILFAFDYSAYTLLSRQLIYTAMTRAIKKLIMICENDALIHAVDTDMVSQRNTFLCEFLREKEVA